MASKDDNQSRYNDIKEVLRHIKNVRENAELLADRLLASGEDEEFCISLLANVASHDRSKLYGIEKDWLHDRFKESNPTEFMMAFHQHVTTNRHHPQFWGGIEDMPRIYVAEMVCDWKARSGEQGGDLREYIKNVAAKRFGISLQGKCYKWIKHFVDLLLENKFVAPS